MAATESEAIVRRIFDAFARKEGMALRGLFAEDAVWTVPGRGAMAGVYRGRESIFRFLARLPQETDGTYGSELLDVLTSGRGQPRSIAHAGRGLDGRSSSTRFCCSRSRAGSFGRCCPPERPGGLRDVLGIVLPA